MASSRVAELPKLFAVTLIRSGIRQPFWEKRTLKALGLTRLRKTVIHKNTPSVNGQLNSVKHLVSITPIRVQCKAGELGDSVAIEDKSSTPLFLTKNGAFDMDKYLEHCELTQKNPQQTLDESKNILIVQDPNMEIPMKHIVS